MRRMISLGMKISLRGAQTEDSNRAPGLSLKSAKVEQKHVDYFKKLLTQWLDELLGRAGDTVVGLIASEGPPSDPLDEAVLEAEHSYMLRIRDRESVLIKKIQASLEDIEDGVYGVCDDCGTDISIERLKARPVARRCILCKTRQEKRERLLGTGGNQSHQIFKCGKA